jgi:hypothetical protein
MLIKSLVESTVELQGFQVVAVNYDGADLVPELAPDHRYRGRPREGRKPH